MINAILEWIAGWILKYLADKAVAAAKQAAADVKRDQERQVINDQNVKRYEEATARQDRINAAQYLLNRESAP